MFRTWAGALLTEEAFYIAITYNFLSSNGVPHLLSIYNSVCFVRLEESSLAERFSSLKGLAYLTRKSLYLNFLLLYIFHIITIITTEHGMY